MSVRRPRECARAEPLLGTIVRVHVIDSSPTDADGRAQAAIIRALGWFRQVESCCSRFDPSSELRQLTGRPGVAVPVSPLLFEAVQFAVALAHASGGAFDPSVGLAMETLGFNREHRTGRAIRSSGVAPNEPLASAAHETGSYREITCDPDARTVTLHRPLVLDLGGVAKGLAIDLAVRELDAFAGFAIDAGGDLYLGGLNADGEPWRVGIRDPRDPDVLLEAVRVSNLAVCTSGDYERRTADGRAHHILDPRVGESAAGSASVTVIAPTAVVADGLATAAFVLGAAGISFLERHGVEGLIVTADRARYATSAFPGERR